MAFDAAMLSCVIDEIKKEILGAKVEKIHQPQKDQLVIVTRAVSGGKKLLIDAGSNNPRIGFTYVSRENPPVPPMFCMLLRKHLTGARLINIEQPEFERSAELQFEGYDEMGFPCKRYLIAEVMGKYSNIIFADEDKKIISVLKPVDFSTSTLRQLLPGMTYTLPPVQDKLNPVNVTENEFYKVFDGTPEDKSADKFITSNFLGVSASLAREISHRASCGNPSPTVSECGKSSLWREFSDVISSIKEGRYEPNIVFGDSGLPVEYCFTRLTHYGDSFKRSAYPSLGEMLDTFFETRDREQRVRQRGADLLKLLTNAEARILKKLDIQKKELLECEMGEELKKKGDLITQNIYLLKKGMTKVSIVDYYAQNEDGSFPECEILLDERLTPAQNAQRFYKKYGKLKTAKRVLGEQIELGQRELDYIYTVFDSLTKAETAQDLSEIRDELYRGGYASKMKGYSGNKKAPTPQYMQFKTSGGFRVLCGKNNIQNDYISHKVATKTDYWFHAKGVPGSHVVMLCDGKEPDVVDFTEAAEIAAHYSKATGGHSVEVDYTLVKNLKKPPSAKLGYVIYHTNWSAIVTPDAEKVANLKIK